MDRRVKLEDSRNNLEQQCFHLFPDRWVELYYEDHFGFPAPGSDEIPVNDVDEIDRFMQMIEGKRSMSGGDLDQDDSRWLV